jgi:hypothetical protein
LDKSDLSADVVLDGSILYRPKRRRFREDPLLESISDERSERIQPCIDPSRRLRIGCNPPLIGVFEDVTTRPSRDEDRDDVLLGSAVFDGAL